MTDATALLANIAANRNDDLPRLVYADWLDEHGHDLRANVIRWGVARPFNLAVDNVPRLVRNRGSYSPTWDVNIGRSAFPGCYAAIRAVYPPPDPVGWSRLTLRRGFITHVSGDMAWLVLFLPAVVTQEPVVRFVLVDDRAPYTEVRGTPPFFWRCEPDGSRPRATLPYLVFANLKKGSGRVPGARGYASESDAVADLSASMLASATGRILPIDRRL